MVKELSPRDITDQHCALIFDGGRAIGLFSTTSAPIGIHLPREHALHSCARSRDKIYFVARSLAYEIRVDEYDIATGETRALPSIFDDEDLIGELKIVFVADRLYVFSTRRAWILKGESWRRIAQPGTSGSRLIALAAVPSHIYLMYTSANVDTSMNVDTSTSIDTSIFVSASANEWVRIPTPPARHVPSMIVAMNERKLWAIGAFIDVYDIARGTWITVGPTPIDYGARIAVACGRKIMLCASNDRVHVLHTETHAWYSYSLERPFANPVAIALC